MHTVSLQGRVKDELGGSSRMAPRVTDDDARIEALQESVHDEGYDYAGTPHLHHPELRGWIIDLASAVARRAVSRGLPPRVLEIGAGDGGLTEPLLARGFEVTGTEVSRHAIDRLQQA